MTRRIVIEFEANDTDYWEILDRIRDYMEESENNWESVSAADFFTNAEVEFRYSRMVDIVNRYYPSKRYVVVPEEKEE